MIPCFRPVEAKDDSDEDDADAGRKPPPRSDLNISEPILQSQRPQTVKCITIIFILRH